MENSSLSIFTSSQHRKSRVSKITFDPALQNKFPTAKKVQGSTSSIANDFEETSSKYSQQGGKIGTEAFQRLMKGVGDIDRKIQSKRSSGQGQSFINGNSDEKWKMFKVTEQKQQKQQQNAHSDKNVGTSLKYFPQNFNNSYNGPIPQIRVLPSPSQIVHNIPIHHHHHITAPPPPPHQVYSRPMSSPKMMVRPTEYQYDDDVTYVHHVLPHQVPQPVHQPMPVQNRVVSYVVNQGGKQVFVNGGIPIGHPVSMPIQRPPQPQSQTQPMQLIQNSNVPIQKQQPQPQPQTKKFINEQPNNNISLQQYEKLLKQLGDLASGQNAQSNNTNALIQAIKNQQNKISKKKNVKNVTNQKHVTYVNKTTQKNVINQENTINRSTSNVKNVSNILNVANINQQHQQQVFRVQQQNVNPESNKCIKTQTTKNLKQQFQGKIDGLDGFRQNLQVQSRISQLQKLNNNKEDREFFRKMDQLLDKYGKKAPPIVQTVVVKKQEPVVPVQNKEQNENEIKTEKVDEIVMNPVQSIYYPNTSTNQIQQQPQNYDILGLTKQIFMGFVESIRR